jgi:hypothetical protein
VGAGAAVRVVAPNVRLCVVSGVVEVAVLSVLVALPSGPYGESTKGVCSPSVGGRLRVGCGVLEVVVKQDLV